MSHDTTVERTSAIRYRPHVDGLRAVAVIAVILYHANFSWFTGGFVGVDVFFVISGFLITSIILRDLHAGTFSLLGFWVRRVRRILPALTAVMLTCIVAGYFFMLWPTDFHDLGKAVMAQSVFMSNMLFMISDNYFDQPSRYSPLLHTWTLSVEEQFYVLFPLIVMLCLWLGRRVFSGTKEASHHFSRRGELLLLWTVALIGVVSFLLSVWLVDLQPGLSITIWHDLTPISYATAGFYFLLSRAWELGIGAAVALLAVRIRSVFWSEVAAIAGLIAICASVFFFSDATPFPGVAALLPTLGAVGVIVANEQHHTKVGRLLSWRVLVFIGLISYSLYLWHWPVFVFARLFLPAPISLWVRAGLIALIFAVSYLSYRFIETPFRTKRVAGTRGAAFALGFGSLFVLFALGFLIFRGELSNASRIPPAANTTLAIIANAGADQATSTCFQYSGDASQYGGLCRIGDKNASAEPRFVLWGDSHAEALQPLFDALGKKYGVQGVAFDGSSCIPVSGIWSVTVSGSCAQEQADALQYIGDHNIKTIFLVARWSLYVTGGPDQARSALVTDSYSYAVSTQEALNLFRTHLTAMVQQLTSEGRQVYVVEQAPEQFEFDSRTAFYNAVHTGQTITLQGIAASTSVAYQAPANTAIDGVANIHGVHVIDPSTILCQNDLCALQRGSVLLYRDENHLSLAGAMALEPLFSPIFSKGL